MSSSGATIYSAIGADASSAASAVSGSAVNASPVNSSDDASWLSGLSGLFGSITSGAAGIVRATQSNAPTPPPVYGYPSTAFTPTNANPSVTSIFNLLLSPVILLIVGVFLLFKYTKKSA